MPELELLPFLSYLGLKKFKKSSIPIPQLIGNKREHLERLKVRLKGSVAYE